MCCTKKFKLDTFDSSSSRSFKKSLVIAGGCTAINTTIIIFIIIVITINVHTIMHAPTPNHNISPLSPPPQVFQYDSCSNISSLWFCCCENWSRPPAERCIYNIVAGTYNVQCHCVNQPLPIATLLATIRILHINSLLLHLHQRSALTLSLHLDVCAAKRSHCTPVRAKRSSSRRLSCGAKLHLS